MKTSMIIFAVVVILATGCTPLKPSGCHKTTAMGNCGSGRWDDQDEWGAQARAIRNTINANITEPDRWKGKKCRLHMEFAEDGTALKVSTSIGNKGYCAAVKAAAERAKFPPFPSPQVYWDFQQSRFDMGS